jgi:hypothetical protein
MRYFSFIKCPDESTFVLNTHFEGRMSSRSTDDRGTIVRVHCSCIALSSVYILSFQCSERTVSLQVFVLVS